MVHVSLDYVACSAHPSVYLWKRLIPLDPGEIWTAKVMRAS